MKTFQTTAILGLIGLLASSAAAQIPPGYEVIRLSQGPVFHHWPHVNNNSQVVYSARLGGTEAGEEIFLYDGNTGVTTRLTNDNVQDRFPTLNDDGVITWSKFIGPAGPFGPTGEIMVRAADGVITRLTDDGVDDFTPSINRWGRIAWDREMGPRACRPGIVTDIFFYDGQNIFPITTDAVSEDVANQWPILNDLDQIVWTRYDFCVQPDWVSQIRMYDNGVTTTLTNGEYQPQVPSLNNRSIVAWEHRALPHLNRSIQIWNDGLTTDLTDWGGGPSLNDSGSVVFNRWHDNSPLCCWQRWLYKDGVFWQLTDGEDWNVDGSMNSAGETAWMSDFDPLTLAGAISFMRRFSIGDVNCDGDVNAFDIEPFLTALFDPDGYPGRYPDCDPDLADIDQNGTVNAFDIEPFIDLLFP